jgi:hypothetical protein
MLVGASLAAASPFAPLHAQYIEPTSNAEKFMYATVRIVGKNASGEDAGGTGFLYKINLPNKEWTVILITNKHVVSDIATGVNIDVHTQSPSAGRPDGIDNIRLDKAQWVDHPDREIDLCAYPIQQNFNELKSPAFFSTLDKSLIP